MNKEKINEKVEDYLTRIATLNENIDERMEWIIRDVNANYLVEAHKREIADFECKIDYYEQEIDILEQ